MTETMLKANDLDARQAARIFRDHIAGIEVDHSTGPWYEGPRGWNVRSATGWQARESSTTDEAGNHMPLLRVFAPNGVQYNCGLSRAMIDAALSEDAERELRPWDQRRIAWPQPDGTGVLSLEYLDV